MCIRDSLWATLPVWALVIRIGEIQSATGPNPDIVRAIQQFPLVILHHNGGFACGIDAPELILLVGAGPEIAIAIERKAIGPSARLPERGELAIQAPFHNAV